jgi:hypothetical protein
MAIGRVTPALEWVGLPDHATATLASSSGSLS